LAMRNQKKEKVFICFDGSNFYHILRSPKIDIHNTLRFDYKKFADWLADGRNIIACKYYVGIIKFDPHDSVKSQKRVSNQQRLFSHLEKQKIEIVRGYLMKNNGVYKEKGVDVRIAVDLLSGAYENQYDTFILISSDTDLIPAIQKAILLGKNVEYIGSSHGPSFGLIKTVSESKLLTKRDLKEFEAIDKYKEKIQKSRQPN